MIFDDEVAKQVGPGGIFIKSYIEEGIGLKKDSGSGLEIRSGPTQNKGPIYHNPGKESPNTSAGHIGGKLKTGNAEAEVNNALEGKSLNPGDQ